MNSGLLSPHQWVYFPLRHPLVLCPLNINFTVLVLGSFGAQRPSVESEVRWNNMGLVTKSTFNTKKDHQIVGIIVGFFFSYLNVVFGHYLIIYHPPGYGILKYYHKKRFSLFAELWPKCFMCTNYFNFTAILQDSYFVTRHQDSGK